MGCKGCSVAANNGKAAGCKNNGGCSTGGCNKLNTYDWLSNMSMPASDNFDIIEVSFKNGSRKEFFHNPPYVRANTGDMVVVESGSGYDVGQVSLAGEIVKMQMKRKRLKDGTILGKLIRLANNRDLEKLEDVRKIEKTSMIKARIIARTLDLEMKIGDVEYQGDRRKATFYYTANGRVDFRELIRHYAKEFKVKIEMRQIGARQESARIGGLGSCGRELCCSTWLTDFKSVNTSAARYQNIAINQSKLSGQCGRLKCCLNFELDTYMDALKHFPKKADNLMTTTGKAILIKTDIFKGIMHYVQKDHTGRNKFYSLDKERVFEILEMNKRGEKPSSLVDFNTVIDEPGRDEENEEVLFGAEDLTGVVELPIEKKKRRSRSRNRNKQTKNKRPEIKKTNNKKSATTKDKPKVKDTSKPNPKAKNESVKPNKNTKNNRNRSRRNSKRKPPKKS